MEKKEMNKVVIAVVAVALIITIIGGSTFAYWQWVTATEQQTFVNVTVQDGISMTITPTTTQTNVLYPITRDNCMDAAISGTALVEIVNNTGIEARPQFYLKLKIEDSAGNNITQTYAQYIHFAVLDPENPSTGTTCANATRYGQFTTTQTTNDLGQTISGWYNSPIITELTGTGEEVDSTRFPILTATDTKSMTFSVPADTTGTHTYQFWAWIDSSYTATNTGNTISDKLQDAKITISWSESCQVKQVTEAA